MEILIATRNRGKVQEVEACLMGMNLALHSLRPREAPEPLEDGMTLKENAIKKALYYSNSVDIMVLADDSGLMVDHLDGRPGVLSSRYAGPGASDEKRCFTLLKELEGVPWEERTARFECVIALAQSGELIQTFTGVCRGYITFEMRGSEGFGYDPIFYFPPLEKTFAELMRPEKEKVSHRGAALLLVKQFLEEQFL